MSLNNFANRRPARELRAPRILSIAEAMEEVEKTQEEIREYERREEWRQWRRAKAAGEGRAKLFEQGHEALRAALPDVQFGRTVRTGGGRPDYVDKDIAVVAQQAGWMKAVASGPYPLVRRLIKKTNRMGAFGGDRSPVTVFEMIKAYPSPGKFERMVGAVLKRANAILLAYTGQPRVSYKGVALALMAETSVGKAAVMAVALTYGLDAKNYRTARVALIDLKTNYPIVRKDDGISSRIGREPVLEDAGVAVYAAKFSGEGRVGLSRDGWLVASGNRSFHVERTFFSRQSWRYITISPGAAIAQAREGWELQDRSGLEEEIRQARAKTYEQLQAELVAFLDGTLTGACPLIRREDSCRAGNCQPGTDEWVLRQGWRRKTFIPGIALIPYLGDDRVRRVVVALKREFTSM